MNNIIPAASSAMVRPEILASKFAAVLNYEAPNVRQQLLDEPRLTELLWFVQAMSIQPGGLAKFVEDLVARYPDRFITAGMVKLGNREGKCTLEEKLELIKEFPEWCLDKIVGSNAWLVRNSYLYRGKEANDEVIAEFEKTLQGLDLRLFCRQQATTAMPTYLASVCNEKETCFEDQWYLTGLLGLLIEAMEWHREKSQQSLAMTAVALKVFDALDYAWSERAMVRIEGDTRFGKTEAVKTWCRMNPGQARLVQTPCSNSDADLYRAVAEAFGLDFSYQTSIRKLKEKVEYVLRFAGLMPVFDEAHFLLPTRFTANTPPMRLNWVRTQIVDRKCPVALVTTPQTYKHCVEKFVKATGHNIDQFLGRTMMQAVLPRELEFNDLLAVARIHFPEVDSDYLELIASKAQQSESYLFAVESIAKRARYISKRDNHPTILLEDLDLAIAEVIPHVEMPAPGAGKRQPQQPNLVAAEKARKTTIEKPSQEGFKGVSRGVQTPDRNRLVSQSTPQLSPGRRVDSEVGIAAA